MLHFFRKIRQKLLAEGKLKSYTLYAIGEILLIVVGILIAVQIGNWNQSRLNKIEETRILQSIQDELAIAIADRENSETVVRQMIASLDAVERAFSGEPISDNFEFLSHVTKAAQFGWGQPNVKRTTYDELMSSGKFGRITSSALRESIARFYIRVEATEIRGNLRVSEFGPLSYELVPREDENMSFAAERSVKKGMSDEAYEQITQSVLNSELDRYIIATRNRYQLILFSWSYIKDQATELRDEIGRELDKML